MATLNPITIPRLRLAKKGFIAALTLPKWCCLLTLPAYALLLGCTLFALATVMEKTAKRPAQNIPSSLDWHIFASFGIKFAAHCRF